MDPNFAFDGSQQQQHYAYMNPPPLYTAAPQQYDPSASAPALSSSSSSDPFPSPTPTPTPTEDVSPAGSAGQTSFLCSTVPAACLACVCSPLTHSLTHSLSLSLFKALEVLTGRGPRVKQRGKHLKCDGQTPCGRCHGTQQECVYVASRRGYKGPRRGTAANPNKRRASASPSSSSSSPPPLPPSLPSSSSSSSQPPQPPIMPAMFGPAVGLHLGDAAAAAHLAFPSPSVSHPHPAQSALQLVHPLPPPPAGIDFLSPSSSSSQQQQVSARRSADSLAARCLDSFYHHFHAAHPFLLPKAHLLRYAKQTGRLEHLLAAVRWVGSLYLDVGDPVRASLFEEAYSLAFAPTRARDAFLVQALLLLTLGLDGSCQQDKARVILADVESLAVAIALNMRPFAAVNGQGDPVLEESWRRTWWDLFVADGMIAGVHRVTNFALFDVPADVALPCEEHRYMTGVSQHHHNHRPFALVPATPGF